jgi:triosephosphate isomerase
MRKKIVAGNWKSNLTVKEGCVLAKDIASGLPEGGAAEVILFPTFLHLLAIQAASPIPVGAQNCSAYHNGAYTGEVSTEMLAAENIQYVLLGHSERRQYFGKTDAAVAVRLQRVLESKLTPVICVGEMLEARNAGQHFDVVRSQLQNGVFSVEVGKPEQLIIAYEPVWAIGTGHTATTEQAQEMHAFIRTSLGEKYGSAAEHIRILYGGSCKPDNAASLFACPDVDGGLIGGASLKANDFLAIVNAVKI